MSTHWKALKVYFQIDPISLLDSSEAKNNRQNDRRTSRHGLSHLYLVQLTRGLYELGFRPQHPIGCSPTYINKYQPPESTQILFC